MRVLFVTSFTYPHAGGLSTHISMMVDYLPRLGHEAKVISFSNLSQLQQLRIRGISYLLNRMVKGQGIVYTNRARIGYLRRVVAAEVKNGSYDLINAEDPAAMLAVAGLGLPVILTVHGYATYEYISIGSVEAGSPAEKELLALEGRAYRSADALVAVDTRINRYLKENFDRDSVIIRNFVDLDRFKPELIDREKSRRELGIEKEAIVLFCPRRLTEKNGVIYPAMAMAILREKYPQLRLYYAGDGEERPPLEQYIREKGLQDRVFLLGAVPHEKIREYYAAADIVLIPSVHAKGIEEATSIAAIEGMALERPVVASAIGGLKELIEDGESGLLVEEKNPAALAAAISALVEDADLREKIARGGRKRVEEHFSLDKGVQRYLEVYKEVLQKTRGAR